MFMIDLNRLEVQAEEDKVLEVTHARMAAESTLFWAVRVQFPARF